MILHGGTALTSWSLSRDPLAYTRLLAESVNCTSPSSSSLGAQVLRCLKRLPVEHVVEKARLVSAPRFAFQRARTSASGDSRRARARHVLRCFHTARIRRRAAPRGIAFSAARSPPSSRTACRAVPCRVTRRIRCERTFTRARMAQTPLVRSVVDLLCKLYDKSPTYRSNQRSLNRYVAVNSVCYTRMGPPLSSSLFRYISEMIQTVDILCY